MVAAPLPAPLPVFSLQGTRSLRVIRTQHPSGSGGSPGESWVCGRSPSASKWSPSAGSEGPGLGQTVEGRGREGSLGDLAWEGKAGSPTASPADSTAKLLAHQWLQRLELCQDNTMAS